MTLLTGQQQANANAYNKEPPEEGSKVVPELHSGVTADQHFLDFNLITTPSSMNLLLSSRAFFRGFLFI